MLTIRPATPRAIQWRAVACERKNRLFRFDRHHRVPIGLGEVDEIGAADDAGIVDEDVRRAEALGQFPQHRREVPAGLEIADDLVEAHALRLHRGAGLRHGARAEADDVGAGLGERRRQRPADAGARAGDQRDLAGEVEQAGDAHLSSPIGTKSMSAKDWLSPAIAQMKA